MKAYRKQKLLVWLVLALVALLGLTFYVALELFSEVHSETLPKTVSEIGKELFKTVFVGVCIGAGVELYLKHIMGDPSKEMLERSGIAHLYSVREDVADEFFKVVHDKKTRILYIVGISLRGFLTEQGSMRPVWNAILDRLENEQKTQLSDKHRLRVRLLLLDPRSSEGYFRYKVEEPLEVDNPVDIDQGLLEVKRVQKRIYQGPQTFLQVRLYNHCPFSFLFLTRESVFIEQYYYQDHTKEVNLPLIKYNSDTSQYSGLRGSLNIIWENAHSKGIKVGTAIPIDKARINNIFREDKRAELTKRQLDCIRNTQTGTVDILAVTATHYVSHDPTLDALLKIAKKEEGKESTTVRFALVNPVSQQAILRAVADNHATEKIRETLCNWDWGMHRRSRLYSGVYHTTRCIIDWKSGGHSFELRLYSSSITCALLLTPKSFFIEQYIYGRSRRLQGRQLIAREYPLIEYEVSEAEDEDKTEQEIISCTFKVVWDHYSISYEEYETRNEEEEFYKNLSMLREELGCGATKV